MDSQPNQPNHQPQAQSPARPAPGAQGSAHASSKPATQPGAQPSNQSTAQPSNQPAAGPPNLGRPVTPTYEPLAPPPPQKPSKLLIGIAVAGLVLVVFGIVRSLVSDPEPKPQRQAQPSIWSQQQQLAREAIDMAKQAQQMQREHMQQMRRAMEQDYGYMEGAEGGFDNP